MMNKVFFSTIEVTRQVFFRNALSYAIVNLMPLVPGHVLVAPLRPVKRISELNPDELSSLFTSVQKVGQVVERVYGGDSLTIACQDGKAAGQSIPHVHIHILPRKLVGDPFAVNDDVYPALEEAEKGLLEVQVKAQHQNKLEENGPKAVKAQAQSPSPFRVDADADRKPRTEEEMVKEAEWLKSFFEKDP